MGQFAQIPNDTLRDRTLSYLARGLLAEALSHVEGWRHDGAEAIWRRAREARGEAAESRRVIQAAVAELELHGYRHRLRWRDADGELRNEIRYCATAAKCGDQRCLTCPDLPGLVTRE